MCRILELDNPSKVRIRLKGDGVSTREGVSLTTNQHGKTTKQRVKLLFINEPNLYRCIFQSRKKEAEQFLQQQSLPIRLLLQSWLLLLHLA